jgi:hypothetical protein
VNSTLKHGYIKKELSAATEDLNKTLFIPFPPSGIFFCEAKTELVL